MTRAEIMRRHPVSWVVLLEDGCDLAESCFDCPLSRCRFDDPAWLLRSVKLARDLAMADAREREGLTIEGVAERFKVDQRTVYRALDNARRNSQALLPEEAAALWACHSHLGEIRTNVPP